jgi:hypothetical protein
MLLPDGVEWNFYRMSEPGHTVLADPGVTPCTQYQNDWNATVTARHVPGWRGTGYDSADLEGYRATKIAAGAGLLRRIDMQMPAGSTWPHALSLVLPTTSSGAVYPRYVQPARRGDGTTATNQGIPEGARVQLDPSINVNTWPSLASAPEWMRMYARTLQTYGGVVTDTGRETSSEGPVSSWGPWNGFSTSNTQLPADLYPRLRVIDWNLWTGI